MKIFIAGSVKPHIPNKYITEAKKLGSYLSNSCFNVICSPNNTGIIGNICNEFFRDYSSNISFVIPKFYLENNNFPTKIEKITDTINQRTDYFLKESDISIFLPGGFGTIYELFCAIETKKGKEHTSKIIIVNSFGFFDDIIKMLEKLYTEHFAIKENKKLYTVINSVDETIEYIKKTQKNK